METEGINYFSTAVILGVIMGTSTIILFYILSLLKPSTPNQNNNNANKTEKPDEAKKDAGKKKKGPESWTRSDKQGFTHPWLLTSLKGHSSQVLDMDFASNGKYLASSAEDRTVLLWDTKDLTQKEHKSLRINIEFDHPTCVKWSPDCKAFIISKYQGNTVEVYKVEKKKDGWLAAASKALTFPKVHENDIIAIGIACTGKFIMTCSNKTDLVVWDLRGQELARVDTYLMNTSCAKISSCGKFIVASGFAPDVKVWEVIFSKTGEFQEVKRVYELTGHTSGVYDVAFDVNTSHMATVSKDGTWKLFDTKVDYKRGEDPHLKITGKYEMAGSNAHIALSPNAEVVVIGTYNTLTFYSTLTGEIDAVIENIFNSGITSLLFDSSGKYVLVAGERYIRVFHNVTGYRCDITTAKEKLKSNQTSATKERLENVIKKNELFLETLGMVKV